jgi:hypothetical protein
MVGPNDGYCCHAVVDKSALGEIAYWYETKN